MIKLGKKYQQRLNLKSKKNFTEKKKKTVKDYYFYISISSQASNFTRTKDYLINNIKMMSGLGNDIAETLRTGIKIDTNT